VQTRRHHCRHLASGRRRKWFVRFELTDNGVPTTEPKVTGSSPVGCTRYRKTQGLAAFAVTHVTQNHLATCVGLQTDASPALWVQIVTLADATRQT